MFFHNAYKANKKIRISVVFYGYFAHPHKNALVSGLRRRNSPEPSQDLCQS